MFNNLSLIIKLNEKPNNILINQIKKNEIIQ